MYKPMQSIKLFDQKFIAINLKRLLRCPKCQCEYSECFEKGLKSNRPFLLPCGHNMCENCLQENHQSLACAVCLKPSEATKHAKHESKNNSKFFVRDFYDMNYHILGNLRNMHYFRRFGSVNNSLNISLVGGGNATMQLAEEKVKCSECETFNAKGQCNQCDAYYCNKCFSTIHLHSKVLKVHTFTALKELRKGNNITIGDTVFFMPMVKFCRLHRKPKLYFCPPCKLNCCDICVKQYHYVHKVYSALQQNASCVRDIDSLLDAIESSETALCNSKKLTQSIENQLSDYAAETLENIANYFLYLHGVLQNEELRITESLREMSLVPQSKLKYTLNKLNDYEKVLNKMRVSMNAYKEKLPNNVFLNEVIRNFYKNLENIPTELHVTKISTNPFVFKKNKNFFEQQLQNAHQYNYIDPNLLVQCVMANGSNKNVSTPYASFVLETHGDRYSINSTSPDGAAAAASDASNDNSKNKENKKPRKNNNKRNTPQDDGKKCTPYKQFASRMSAAAEPSQLLKSNRNVELEIANTTDLALFSSGVKPQYNDDDHMEMCLVDERKETWLKANTLVHITHVETPDSFYVKNIDLSAKLRELSKSYIIGSITSSVPKSIVVGNIYMAYHALDKEWYRALVERCVKPDVYRVFLVDIGVHIKVDQVECKKFRELEDKHAAIPFAALRCAIRDIIPAGYEWTHEANNLLHEITQNRSVTVSMAEEIGKNYYKVDLLAQNNNTNISIREAFLYTGLAHERPGNLLLQWETTKAPPKCAPPKQRIPELTKIQSEISDVLVLNVDSPDQFYVLKRNRINERDQMLDDLKRYFNSLSDAQLETIYLAMPKLGCVIKSEGRWQRASVEEILDKGEVRVFLVDTGYMATVHWRCIYALPPSFQQKQYTMRCALADIQPLQQNNYKWTAGAIADFKQLSSNPHLDLHVVKTNNNLFEVMLYIAKKHSFDINIAAILVKHGHAVSTGQYSKPKAQIVPYNAAASLDFDPATFFNPISGTASPRNRISKTTPSTPKAALPSAGSNATKKDFRRTPIKILRIVSPSEFYVSMESVTLGVKEFHEKVQQVAQSMFAARQLLNTPVDFKSWQTGDHCLLNLKIQHASKQKWYRGIIADISPNNPPSTCKVFLRDMGMLIENVPITEIYTIDATLDRASNIAACCYLAGLEPFDSNKIWTNSTIEVFKTELAKYSKILATKVARKMHSIGVILWGLTEQAADPVGPATQHYININESIFKLGFALWMPNIMQNLCESNALLTDDAHVPIDKWLKKIDELNVVAPSSSSTSSVKTDDDAVMSSINLLCDLNELKNAKQKQLPPDWQKPRPLNKTLFTAMPTYVDYCANVYINLPSDNQLLKKIKESLHTAYKPLFDCKRYINEIYAVNQPCVVIYHRDQYYYRGIVNQCINQTDGTYKVYFVDYGNMETLQAQDMIPYAPFPKLHSLTTRLSIYGIQPKDGYRRYTTNVLDSIHVKLVDQLVSVSLKTSTNDKHKPSNGIHAAIIRVGAINIADFLLENDFVEWHTKEYSHRHYHRRQLEYYENKNLTKTEADVEEEEEEVIAAGEEEQLLAEQDTMSNSLNVTNFFNESNSQQLLKGRVFDWAEFTDVAFNTAYDNNTVEPKQSAILDEILSQRGDVVNVTQHDDDDMFGAFSNNFNTTDIQDDFDMFLAAEQQKSSNTKPNLSKFEDKQISEQLLNRARLHHQELLEMDKFCPLETSTAFSLSSKGFKDLNEPKLPLGIKEFYCTISSIVTSTDLHIFPEITEMRKIEAQMLRDIKQLVETLPSITECTPNMFVLACYSKDEEWYRGMVRSYNRHTCEAVILYIDYLNTETLPLRKLKAMPAQMLMWPLRTCHVKLHGIKPNPEVREKDLRRALYVCLATEEKLYARIVVNNTESNSSNSSGSTDVTDSEKASGLDCKDVRCVKSAVLEVELYKNHQSMVPIYQYLIDDRNYLPNHDDDDGDSKESILDFLDNGFLQ